MSICNVVVVFSGGGVPENARTAAKDSAQICMRVVPANDLAYDYIHLAVFSVSP
jgi:hypothetical protein